MDNVRMPQQKLNRFFRLGLGLGGKTKKHKRVIPNPCIMTSSQVTDHRTLQIVLQTCDVADARTRSQDRDV